MVNKLLIKLDGRVSSAKGFSISDAGEVSHYLPITGTVVRPPSHLIFKKDELESTEDVFAQVDLRRASLDVYPTYTPVAGDRVMFSYLANDFESPTVVVDGEVCNIVDYDMLVGKIDQDGVPVHLCNGYLLVEVDESVTWNGFELAVSDKNKYGVGTVRYAAPVTRYLDYPDDEDESILPGSRVIYNKRFAARLEVDGLHRYNSGKQSSLFKIHRKDILMYA